MIYKMKMEDEKHLLQKFYNVEFLTTIVHISQVLLLFSFLQIIRSTSSFQSGIVQVQRPRVLFTSPIFIESSNVSGNGVPS